MHIWMGTAFDYMEAKGFPVPPPLRERLMGVSSVEAACVLCEAFPRLGMTPEALLDAWRATIKRRYQNDITYKPGAEDYLRKLRARGIPICVATLTPRDYFTPAFERTGLAGLIDFSINAAEAGRDKHWPDIYLRCAERFGLSPADCRVYEDSHIAAKTAKAAGFEVWGIADGLPAHLEDELRATADRFVENWDDLTGLE